MSEPHSSDELRERNEATVGRYFLTGARDRARRHLLYTDDGSTSLFFTDIGEPITVRGRDNLAKHGELSLKVLPDWRWIGLEIFPTQDPGRFWAECDGEGTIRFPGYPEGRYRNHFLFSFRLSDGRIAESREYTNPIEHMRALGIATPRIERGWIPAE